MAERLTRAMEKTEWTREEDEKLLHLAKLMPTQWRTIAPIVGRTPAQCLERYEKLLDAAAQRDEDYDPADDPRRLRPGEIDPNPESKPARPDAVDADALEKEIARRRGGATGSSSTRRGKKAKRKAREKQLEEARRLASLQKKRELKAAGIETVKRAKRAKGLDYNAEIAFEKKPAPGFYDVSEERAAQPAAFDESAFKPVTMEEMEGPRKKDLEEQLRKQDAKRAQIAERHDALGAARTAANLNDPGAVRRRNALVLPAPRVSERELEEIAKLGRAGGAAADFEPGVEDTPGGTLLGDYARASALPGTGPAATPARTPSAGGHDAILREAAHLAVLSKGQTPLLGGENVSLAGSDFSGITPARRDAPTPNPMAAGATPARSGAASVSATPLRDALRINDARAFPFEKSRDAERRAAATRDRKELRDGLASLPAPANEYRVEVPDAPEEAEDDEGDGADVMEEDLADIRAREAERKREEEAAALRRRSAAIRRALPRPPPGSRGPATEASPSELDAGGSIGASALSTASTLIAAELASLLAHDAARYPPRGEKARAAEAAPDLPRVEESEMAAAAALVAAEVPEVQAEMGHADVSPAAIAEALASARAEMAVGGDGQLVARKSLSKAQRVALLERELASLAAAAAADAKRVAKLEHKAGLLTAGLQKRAEALLSKLGETGDALAAAREEKASYERLHEREQRAAPRRIETLMELASAARARDAGLQEKYERLSR